MNDSYPVLNRRLNAMEKSSKKLETRRTPEDAEAACIMSRSTFAALTDASVSARRKINDGHFARMDAALRACIETIDAMLEKTDQRRLRDIAQSLNRRLTRVEELRTEAVGTA